MSETSAQPTAATGSNASLFEHGAHDLIAEVEVAGTPLSSKSPGGSCTTRR